LIGYFKPSTTVSIPKNYPVELPIESMDEECGEASREAMHHTAIAAAEYDGGDGFDIAVWAAASGDTDAQEFQDNT
jgi:hypothetical protein